MFDIEHRKVESLSSQKYFNKNWLHFTDNMKLNLWFVVELYQNTY